MDNLRGIFLVTFSMAFFALEDLMMKSLSAYMPTGQIMFLLGFGGMVVFGVMALRARAPLFDRDLLRFPLILRTGAEAMAALFFITSLSLVPLSTVASVFQATPLAIAVGAALFMKERVGWRRWTAITLGFVGVLIIIRPGLDGFRPEALFVLGAVVSIATRDLISRRLPDDLSSATVSFYGFGALVVAAPFLMWITGDAPAAMDGVRVIWVMMAVVFGVLGYYAIVLATRMGDASALMPFRHTRLIFSLIIGVTILGETPDGPTYMGAVIIIGTGLYTYLRERKLARAARAV